MQGATVQRKQVNTEKIVSIHAPYAGSDTAGWSPVGFSIMFQSTPPMQGATPPDPYYVGEYAVSIHAPYAGSDGI